MLKIVDWRSGWKTAPYRSHAPCGMVPFLACTDRRFDWTAFIAATLGRSLKLMSIPDNYAQFIPFGTRLPGPWCAAAVLAESVTQKEFESQCMPESKHVSKDSSFCWLHYYSRDYPSKVGIATGIS